MSRWFETPDWADAALLHATKQTTTKLSLMGPRIADDP
jgi:hypothetical protein